MLKESVCTMYILPAVLSVCMCGMFPYICSLWLDSLYGLSNYWLVYLGRKQESRVSQRRNRV